MPACIFAVGFFVYVLWEAKAQYTEPFFMFLIPMAACGAERIADLLDRIAEGKDRRAGFPSDRNQGIQTPYAESPAAPRPATVLAARPVPLLDGRAAERRMRFAEPGEDGRRDWLGRATRLARTEPESCGKEDAAGHGTI